MITVFAFLVIALLVSSALNAFLVSKVYGTKVPNIKLPKGSTFKLPRLGKKETFNASEYLDSLSEDDEHLILLSDRSKEGKPLKCYKLFDKYYLILRNNTFSSFEDKPNILKDFNLGKLEYDKDATSLASQENIDSFISYVIEESLADEEAY